MRSGWLPRAAFILWISALVGVPVLTLTARGLSGGLDGILAVLRAPTARDALILSLWTAALAALVNGVAGTAVAWALVRWEIPGRRALAALVDLPLAIPTLVAGVLLVALFGPQTPAGGWLASRGWPVAFARPGIVLALLFVTLPFVVRAVEPVLDALDPAEEEAAATLGASRWTTLRRVLLPPILPAVAAGMVQTFARAVAEFGSLAAVSGNIPHRTLVIPVWILGEVEAGDADSAAAASVLLLGLALALQPISRALTGRVLARQAGGSHGAA